MACGDAYSCADYMFCVSSCVSRPAYDATLRAHKREKGRVAVPDFLLLMENILSISLKKCLFYLLPPLLPFALVFFFFFFNWRRFQPAAT